MKYGLGALSRHSGRTVDEVIRESVQTHLQETSFNNTTDLAVFIRSIGLDPARFKKWFPELEEMIARRHHIVHQADRNDDEPAKGEQRARSLDVNTVHRWVTVTSLFGLTMASSLMALAIRSSRAATENKED